MEMFFNPADFTDGSPGDEIEEIIYFTRAIGYIFKIHSSGYVLMWLDVSLSCRWAWDFHFLTDTLL